MAAACQVDKLLCCYVHIGVCTYFLFVCSQHMIGYHCCECYFSQKCRLFAKMLCRKIFSALSAFFCLAMYFCTIIMSVYRLVQNTTQSVIPQDHYFVTLT